MAPERSTHASRFVFQLPLINERSVVRVRPLGLGSSCDLEHGSGASSDHESTGIESNCHECRVGRINDVSAPGHVRRTFAVSSGTTRVPAEASARRVRSLGATTSILAPVRFPLQTTVVVVYLPLRWVTRKYPQKRQLVVCARGRTGRVNLLIPDQDQSICVVHVVRVHGLTNGL